MAPLERVHYRRIQESRNSRQNKNCSGKRRSVVRNQLAKRTFRDRLPLSKEEAQKADRHRIGWRAQAVAADFAADRMASYCGSVAISFTYSTYLTFPSLPTTNTARAVTPASGPSLISTP